MTSAQTGGDYSVCFAQHELSPPEAVEIRVGDLSDACAFPIQAHPATAQNDQLHKSMTSTGDTER